MEWKNHPSGAGKNQILCDYGCYRTPLLDCGNFAGSLRHSDTAKISAAVNIKLPRGFLHSPRGKILTLFCNCINQFFGVIPSQTRVCDRFSEYMIGAADFLASFLQVALDHNTFDKVMNVRGNTAAVQYFLYN